MAPSKEPQLANVLLGNNPSPTSKTGWSKLSGREFDLLSFDYGHDGWSIACNQTLIGPGTIGWIYRSDGSFGHLAGLIVFDGRPKGHKEPGGTVHYCAGMLWRLPLEWWVDGACIAARGWPTGRAPFGGSARRFRNSERMSAFEEAILWNELHEVAREWLLIQVSQHASPMVSLMNFRPPEDVTVSNRVLGLGAAAVVQVTRWRTAALASKSIGLTSLSLARRIAAAPRQQRDRWSTGASGNSSSSTSRHEPRRNGLGRASS